MSIRCLQVLLSLYRPAMSTAKASDSGEIPPATPSKPPSEFAAAASQSNQPPSSSSEIDSIYIPSYSRWFSWTEISDCEIRSLRDFFDSRRSSASFYLYLRNSIIKQYRDDYPRKISFTDVRRTLVSDVVSIRRVFDFLDSWGLINYTSSASGKPLKWDEKEAGRSNGEAVSENPTATVKESAKRICNGCKAICSIACFACDKYALTLCARCYVRGNYRIGINSSEFKRVEISEESKTEWSEKETLQLLEAVMHHGDDWKKVAPYVVGRTEKDCVSQFVKLPFGEQFVKESDSEDAFEGLDQVNGYGDDESEGGSNKDGSSSPNKRMKLTPLADASNPLMAQAAFLAALAGANVAEAAARAAVKALSDVDNEAGEDLNRQEINGASSGETTRNDSAADAKSQVDKEEQEVEEAIKDVVEVQMMKIRDRIVHFEKMDIEIERSRKQLEEMKNLLFVDKLNIFFHTRRARQGEEDRVSRLLYQI
ncbi:unnamed protein product [Cochlearia groenlandica]